MIFFAKDMSAHPVAFSKTIFVACDFGQRPSGAGLQTQQQFSAALFITADCCNYYQVQLLFSTQGRLVWPILPAHLSVTVSHLAFGADSQAFTDPVSGANGHRHEAAAAKFWKVVARCYYQPVGHIHGYIYGGSGGSFQTIGALENNVGVWDEGIPIPAPNGFPARAFFGHVLRPKMTQIQDTLKLEALKIRIWH
ncbi:hypothetical protein SVAN01_11798 [Stagonosporopsis vannaccii]|nr:hypothetical protein SVAN01_11798 [Stagonosporopsis vannaccii]